MLAFLRLDGLFAGLSFPFQDRGRRLFVHRLSLGRFDQRHRIALAREKDRIVQKRLRREIALRREFPEVCPGLFFDRLSKRIAAS